MAITEAPEVTRPVRVVGGDSSHSAFPTTGPMPAVALAGGHLQVHDHDGVTVVAIDGGLDSTLTEDIAASFNALLRDADHVVVDLDNATLLNPTGVGALLDLAEPHRHVSTCLVAGRLSSRLILDRWGVTDRAAVFGSVADALQARTFSECGYGTGWKPSR